MSKYITFNQFIKQVTKEEFVEYYSCHNHGDTAAHFNLSSWTMDRVVREFDARKSQSSSNDQMKRTKKERYGSENFVNVEKCKQTKQDRYGNCNYNNSEKNAASRISNSGSLEESYRRGILKNHETRASNSGSVEKSYHDQLMKSWDTRDKQHGSRTAAVQHNLKTAANTLGFHTTDEYIDYWIAVKRATQLDRYGVPSFCNYEKAKETRIQNYGSLEESYRVAREHCEQTMIERYGYTCSFQNPDVRSRSRARSKLNRSFGVFLELNNIEYSEEFPILNRSYDFKVGDMLIEIDPSVTHNSSWDLFDKTKPGLDPYYHKMKSDLAFSNGYRCIHVWDWDNWEKILKLLTPKKKINARDCTIRVVSYQDTKEFLLNHHLQGSCRGQTVCIGLYYTNMLVEVMTFGTPRYNRKYEWELLRLCTHSDYSVRGGASKLFSYFISNFNPKNIISYCDRSKFNGDVYTKLGMSLVSTSGIPSVHWAHTNKHDLHVTDNLLRARGFDQLFGSQFGCFGKGTSNEELMLKHGFVKIFDAGQLTFVYDNPKYQEADKD